jgi:hypothetical protein
MFFPDDKKSKFAFPSICDKKMMINTFLNDENIHSIKSCEIDVYCTSRISQTDNIIKSAIQKMDDNENYVLSFFENNKIRLCEEIGFTEYMYIFVLKSIRLNDFNLLLLNVLPKVLLDIIYMYADFESVVPNILDTFE